MDIMNRVGIHKIDGGITNNAKTELNINCRHMHRIHHIHFIGIGGSGMNVIAEVLLNMGYNISGSDSAKSSVTERLQSLGANIFIGHDAKHIIGANSDSVSDVTSIANKSDLSQHSQYQSSLSQNNLSTSGFSNLTQDSASDSLSDGLAVDLVVRSSAIDLDNVEVLAAKQLHIPIIGRAEMLAEIMRFRFGIAVSGTHGKTTTTSMLATVLTDSCLSPSYLIGGILNREGTGAKLGQGQYLIAEADESDASFLNLTPMMSILLNIDEDHMETYSGDFDKLKQTFIDFLQRMPFYGLAIVCIDDENVCNILDKINRPIKTYGLTEKADICAKNIVANGLQTNFDLYVSGQRIEEFCINMPGKHNVLNSLSVIAVALELEIDISIIKTSLRHFAGVGRRFTHRGDVLVKITDPTSLDRSNSGEYSQCVDSVDDVNMLVPVFEDYGHHPREIAAVLEAARSSFPNKNIVGVFQPHRYSRTRDLFELFSEELAKFDKLVLTEVYPAGEKPIARVDGKSLASAIRARKQVEPIFVKSLAEVSEQVKSILEPNDIVLVMGAGSIGKIATELTAKFVDDLPVEAIAQKTEEEKIREQIDLYQKNKKSMGNASNNVASSIIDSDDILQNYRKL